MLATYPALSIVKARLFTLYCLSLVIAVCHLKIAMPEKMPRTVMRLLLELWASDASKKGSVDWIQYSMMTCVTVNQTVRSTVKMASDLKKFWPIAVKIHTCLGGPALYTG